jgi:type VI secretion system protein ImpJ
MEHAVAWREGLFIRPQHFQQNDRHYNYLLRTLNRESGPNRWGFFDLSIDTELLNSGKLVVNRAYGMMPDGTLFDVSPKMQALIAEIDPADAGRTFYLSLPLSMHHADALAFEEDEVRTTRMVARREQDVPNTNVGENSAAELLLARHNFQLLREEELNEGYDTIALARIGAVSASGAVSLDGQFMPTYLHLHRAEYLTAQLKELMNVLNYRMVKLAEKLSDATIQVAELGDYLLLQLISRIHSRLHFHLSQENVHPQTLFGELSGFASELAVFMKKEKRLEAVFDYTHERQKASFVPLLDALKQMLSMVLEQNSVKLPIEKRKYGIHVAKLEDRSLVDSGAFVLAVTADIPSETLKKMLRANLKMGTIETIRDLVNYHLAGFKLTPLPAAPRQIPYRVNSIYFTIELTAEEKRSLKESGGMAFHLGGEIEGISYTLWAIRHSKD